MRSTALRKTESNTGSFGSSSPRIVGNQAFGDSLALAVEDQMERERFTNRFLSLHAPAPELMAGAWTACRELLLVEGLLDRTTREALGAVFSQSAECPYCSDLIIGLARVSEPAVGSRVAPSPFIGGTSSRLLVQRMEWARSAASGRAGHTSPPFTDREIPVALGLALLFGYANRFSYATTKGYPADAPLGSLVLRSTLLRLVGHEPERSSLTDLRPGESLTLLPAAELPGDLVWAAPDRLVSAALSRWAEAVRENAELAVSPRARRLVERSVETWRGERMPSDRQWVEEEIQTLFGEDRAIGRLALVLAKAPWQFHSSLARDVLGREKDEERYLRILAWACFTGARRVVSKGSNLNVAF